MTTPVEKSTNPSTDTAAQTVGGPPAPHQIATGHEGTVRDQIDSYGCAAIEGEPDDLGAVTITDLVEKPPVADAPSDLAIIGRYVLDPGVFDVLRETQPGRGGEIQLTDALRRMATQGEHGPVHGVVFTGRRYDTGDRLEYLKTVVRLAAERDDLGPDFSTWLKGYVTEELGR